MNSVFFAHFNNSVALFNRVYFGGGDAYITKKLKITVKNICKAIYNYK